jgi:hypothetical protein
MSLSSRQSGHQLGEPDDVEHPPEIVGERGQTQFGADLLQTTHQKCPLVHPLLDRAEWMFDCLTPTVEDTGALCQASLHPVQDRFVLEP